MRAHRTGKHIGSDADDAADTSYNTEVSPEQRAPKLQRGRKLNRVLSNASSLSSADGHSSLLANIGRARAIMQESDEDDDAQEDDDQVLARFRAANNLAPVHFSQSDPFGSSLSSAPPTSSQRDAAASSSGSEIPSRPAHRVLPEQSSETLSQSSADRPAKRTFRIQSSSSLIHSEPHTSSDSREEGIDDRGHDNDDEDEDEAAPRLMRSLNVKRRGAKVSAMKGKGGKALTPAGSDSDSGGDHDSFVRRDRHRTFKLISSSSVNDDDDDAEEAPRPSASPEPMSRKQKMDALAAAAKARARPTTEDADLASDEDVANPDAFLRNKSRSLSIEDHEMSDDDADRTVRALQLAHQPHDLERPQSSKTGGKAPAKRRAAKPKKDEAPKIKVSMGIEECARGSLDLTLASFVLVLLYSTAPLQPLTKKEIETMNRETARISREHRVRLAAPSQRKQINITDLLHKISSSEQSAKANRHGPNAASQEKSQHTSDPIESDPIAPRSSPYSSPLGAAGGPATNKLRFKQLSDAGKPKPAYDADDDDDVDFPETSELLEQARAAKEKKAQWERYQQQKIIMAAQAASRKKGKTREFNDADALTAKEHVDQLPSNHEGEDEIEEDDDIEVLGWADRNKRSTAAATKENRHTTNHMSPGTPGRKRPTDLMYRELGIKPNKTPGRKRNVGTNAYGSPGVGPASSPIRGGNSGAGDDGDDEFVVTDSQLHEAGKAFALASDVAAGKAPPATYHTSPKSAQQQLPSTLSSKEEHSTAAKVGRHQHRVPLPMTKEQLNATLMRKMQTQNLQVRQKKEAQAKKHGVSTVAASQIGGNDVEQSESRTKDQIQAMLDRLNQQPEDADDGEDDEDDPDFLMPEAQVVGDLVGSGSEDGEADDQPLDFGSASEAEAEAEGSQDEEDAIEAHSEADSEAREGDSEKENAPPPASQNSQRPSRAVLDEDEDEAPGPRNISRRRRRAAALDDDDDDDDIRNSENENQPEDPSSDGEHVLQPGRIVAVESGKIPSRERVVLGDISSESLGQASQRDPFGPTPVAAGEVAAEEDSFRTDAISSSPVGGFTQLFAPTQAPTAGGAGTGRVGPTDGASSKGFWDMSQSQQTEQQQGVAGAGAGGFTQLFAPTPVEPVRDARQARPPAEAAKGFWDMSQTQQSQQQPGTSKSQSQLGRGTLERDESVNSALGAFFESTQSQLAGESLDIFANKKNKDGMAKGFTQFGVTPAPLAKGAAEAPSQSDSQWDADHFSMPPPKSTAGFDGFAALRKAQMGDTWEPTPSLLPSLDESQAEREAEAELANGGGAVAASPKKMYLNKEGFFTQTKPATQAGGSEWDYDSQTQNATQLHTPFKLGGSNVVPGDTPTPLRNTAGGAMADHDDEDEGSVVDSPLPKPKVLKRLRRGTTNADADNGDQDPTEEENESVEPPLAQARPNAFDMLRAGAAAAGDQDQHDDMPSVKGKKRKSAFVEGEAEESDDEELGDKGRRGGLGGVFSDEEKGSGSDGEGDDDDSDEDAADLEGLVDDERDDDEAEKDLAARSRFHQDQAEQDEADLKLHMAATRGDLRHRRGKNRGLGIDAFLDEDADEEYLRRKAMAVPGASFKKRKMLDGEVDEMDLLAADEASRAFVQGYAETHRPDEGAEAGYDFLKEEEGQEEEDNEEEDDTEPRNMTRDELVREVRERRRRRQQRGFSDDEEEEEQQQQRDEDDEDDVRVPLRDHIQEKRAALAAKAADAAAAPRRKQLGTTYGRARPSAPVAQEGARGEDDDDEDDDEDAGDGLDMLLHGRRAVVKRTTTGEDEENEPEWGVDTSLSRISAGVSSGGLKRPLATSTTRSESKRPRQSGSLLLSKKTLLSRESQFSG